MNNLTLRIVTASVCCAVWCCCGGFALGQVRSGTGVTFKTVGSYSAVGAGQNYGFRSASPGGGGLRSTGGGYQSAGVLSSSMSNGSRGRGLKASIGRLGGTTALRSGIDTNSGGLLTRSSVAGPSIGGSIVTAVRKGGAIGTGGVFSLDVVGGKGMASAVLGQSTSLAAARGFIASVGESSTLEDADESIKSFAPDQPGQYRDKMLKGEELLRSGSFISAYEQFKVASDIAGRSTEPLLSMAHAKFGVGGYGMTAYYIRRSLVRMPQLPLVPIRPKEFYSSVGGFGDLIINLETYLDEHPNNADALLILAYFRWFTDKPDVAAVRSTLEKALAVSQSESRTEPIQIFWKAIVRSGKANGELQIPPVDKPSDAGTSTTRPADKNAKTPAQTPVESSRTKPDKVSPGGV